MQAVQQNAAWAVSELQLGLYVFLTDREDEQGQREHFWCRSSQCNQGSSETHPAECWCEHVFLIWTRATILYLSDFNLKRAGIQYPWQLSARDEWEQLGCFRRVRFVVTGKPLGVIMRWQIGVGERCRFLAVRLAHLHGTGTASRTIAQSITHLCLVCGWSYFTDASGFDTARKRRFTVTQRPEETLCLLANELLVNGQGNPEGNGGRWLYTC